MRNIAAAIGRERKLGSREIEAGRMCNECMTQHDDNQLEDRAHTRGVLIPEVFRAIAYIVLRIVAFAILVLHDHVILVCALACVVGGAKTAREHTRGQRPSRKFTTTTLVLISVCVHVCE